MGIFHNITTGKDNKTHDVVRLSIVVMTLMFPVLIVWGVGMATWSFSVSKPFDLTVAYEGFSLIIVAFGTYLAQGAGAIYMKRTTEPDGAVTEVTSITAAKQPDQTINIEKTTIVK